MQQSIIEVTEEMIGGGGMKNGIMMTKAKL